MTDDPSAAPGRPARRLLDLVAANWRRLVVDFAVLGVWVLFLAFVFLRSNYPRWAFYALLFLGVVLHAQVTDGYRPPDGGDSSRE